MKRVALDRIAMMGTLPRNGVGAELGVFQGEFSEDILQAAKPRRLFLVDLFNGTAESGTKSGKMELVDMSMMFDVLHERYDRDSVVRVVRACSWAWLQAAPAGSLDWVYIDTDHTYFTTRMELRFAWDAVRPGGVIAGHDYDLRWFPGVPRAVNEFAEEHGLEVELWEGDQLASYKLVKPEVRR